MSLKRTLFAKFGPGGFSGILLGDWIRLLVENRFTIPPAFWIRAGSVSCFSLATSAFHVLERVRYGSQLKDVANAEIEPPIFILGHWRQGTTHLHNLFATDDRFHCPSLFQVCNPHTFLTTESSWFARAGAKSFPAKRPMDDMAWGVALPWEDECAICTLGRYSPYLSWAFPRRRTHYDRYLTMRSIPEHEVNAWKRSFHDILRKLTLKGNRQLVLKSPTHTCRIRLLLEMFPGAKFVHIHRNPFEVFQSTQHQFNIALDWSALQSIDRNVIDEWIIKRYSEMYDMFFSEKALIPEGQFCEVSYELIEKDPVGGVRQIYEAIGLPCFDGAVDKLRAYVASLDGYKKNTFPSLSRTLSERIAQEWATAFKEWGYPTE